MLSFVRTTPPGFRLMIERHRKLNSHLPDVRAANDVRSAIKTIERAARVSRPHSDAITPLFLGGPFALSDLEHVQALLEMMNRPTIGNLAAADFPETADGVADARLFTKTERLGISMILDLIICDTNRGNVESRRAEWMRLIRGHVVRVPSFDVEPDKTLVTDHRAARRYVLLLLSDPKLPFMSQLRQCELASCRRYFLDTGTRPGQRRHYCEDRDCGIEADKIAARVRAKEWREKNAAPRRPR